MKTGIRLTAISLASVSLLAGSTLLVFPKSNIARAVSAPLTLLDILAARSPGPRSKNLTLTKVKKPFVPNPVLPVAPYLPVVPVETSFTPVINPVAFDYEPFPAVVLPVIDLPAGFLPDLPVSPSFGPSGGGYTPPYGGIFVPPNGPYVPPVSPPPPPPPAVPEPMTWAMFLVGFATVGWALRHRRAHLPSSCIIKNTASSSYSV